MNNPDSYEVLIIEDNQADAYLIKFYLSESHQPKFYPDDAETFGKGMEKLREKSYDIILLDLQLPDSRGMETLHRLLEEFPDKLVLVLTNLMDERVGIEALRGGAQDFLVKGKFDSQILTSALLFAIERFKLKKQLDNFRIEALKVYERFDLLQHASGICYAEYRPESKWIYISDEAIKLCGFSSGHRHLSEDDFIQLFSSGKSFFEKILQADQPGFETDFTPGFKIKYAPANGRSILLISKI